MGELKLPTLSFIGLLLHISNIDSVSLTLFAICLLIESGDNLINFMTTLILRRFESYLVRDFSIARIKIEISPFIFEFDQQP